MNQDYVSLETAKLLKEVGYDEPCDYVASPRGKIVKPLLGDKCSNSLKWNNITAIPLLYFAQKWLREKHNIHIEVSLENFTDGYIWGYQILYIGEDCSVNSYDGEFKTYQLALDAGIAKACKMIKEKK